MSLKHHCVHRCQDAANISAPEPTITSPTQTLSHRRLMTPPALQQACVLQRPLADATRRNYRIWAWTTVGQDVLIGDLGHGSALRLTAAIAADPCHTEVAPRSLARSVTSTVRLRSSSPIMRFGTGCALRRATSVRHRSNSSRTDIVSGSASMLGQTAGQAANAGGQGRGRTADLPIFSRTLVPTELPGRCPKDRGPDGRAEPYRSDPRPTKTVRDPDSLMLIRVSGPHRLAAQDPALSRR